MGVLEAEGHTVEYTCGNCGAALMHADEIEVTGSSLSASVSPMARPYFLLRSLVAGLVLAAALCPLQVAPGAERPERQYTRDPIRTYRPRTPAEFFKQDAVRFERVRIDMNGLIYADGHSLSLWRRANPAQQNLQPTRRSAMGLRAARLHSPSQSIGGKIHRLYVQAYRGPAKGCLLGGGRRRRASLAQSRLGGACGGGERGELC